MRTLLIGGGHAAYFAINTLREIDSGGKLIVIDFTREKAEVLSKTFPDIEVIVKGVDEAEQYIRENRVLLDAVIAATESDALNLRYSKISLKNAIPIVIAILNNPLNANLFKKEGIRFIVDPYSSISSKLREIIGVYEVNLIYEHPSDSLSIISVRIEDERKLKWVRENLPKSRVASIYLNVDGSLETKIDKLDVGGTLYLIGEREELRKFLSKIGKTME